MGPNVEGVYIKFNTVKHSRNLGKLTLQYKEFVWLINANTD